jgi:hypothetical protein
MPRRKPTPSDQTEPATRAAVPLVLHPDAVFTLPTLNAAFGLTRSTARREIKSGRLRVAKRAGKYYFLGEWLLEWLRSGELQRKPPTS